MTLKSYSRTSAQTSFGDIRLVKRGRSCKKRAAGLAPIIAARGGHFKIPQTMGFFFSSRRRHTRFDCDWSSDVCSSDLEAKLARDAAVERVEELSDGDEHQCGNDAPRCEHDRRRRAHAKRRPRHLIGREPEDRKSTRLNSSHSQISYAVFCLKKKNVKLG